MRRNISLPAVALACLAFTPQQESQRTIAHLDGEVANGAALSPDGRYLAVAALDRGLLVIEAASGQSWNALEGLVCCVDWSPRGDLLAFSRWDEEAGSDFIWTLPIDPSSGRSVGEARRVSVSAGDVVAFSPDGESIAFADYTYPGQRIMVLPARGGRERALAQAEAGINSIAWSEDGEWIYYAHNAFGSPRGVVARVRAAGGAAEVVWETPAGTPSVIEPGPMIVQPEAGRDMFFVHEAGGPHSSPAVSQGGDRIRILDRTGRIVLTTLRPPPSGQRRDAQLWLSAATADATRFYGTKANREFRLMAVSLADGSARVLDTSPSLQTVATSEAENRVVFLTDVDGALGFVVMAPDGSGRREYRLTAQPAMGPRHQNWQKFVVSPDGNRLAYASRDTQNRLVVLDLRDGSERVLASGGWIAFRWMSNDELQYDRLDDLVRPSRRSIHQVSLSGVDRLLRVISEEGTLETELSLVNDTMAIRETREGVDLIPLPSGEPRVLFRGPNGGNASVSLDHRYVAIKTVGRLAPRYEPRDGFIDNADAIAIVDLATGQRHDLQLELTAPFLGGPAVWHPDGRHLLVNLARGSGEHDTYLVPINGDRPRVLARDTFRNFNYPHLTDRGNTLLVGAAGPRITDIIELTAGGN